MAKDLTGDAMSFVFDIKDKMTPSVTKLDKVWKGFGKLFDKTKKKISGGFDLFTKKVKGMNKELDKTEDSMKDIKRMEAFEGMRDAFNAFRGTQIEGVNDQLESFTKNTKDMRVQLGMSHDEMVLFRAEARATGKALGSGVLNWTLYGEAMESATQLGIKNKKQIQELGASAALLGEFAGAAQQDVVSVMWTLGDRLKIPQEGINRLLFGMAEMRKEKYGVNMTFQEGLDSIKETMLVVESGFSQFDAAAKQNIFENLVSIRGAFQSAFGKDASGLVTGLAEQVAKQEGPLVDLLGGLSKSRELLTAGDPVGILEQMQKRFKAIGSERGMALLADGAGMAFEDVQILRDGMDDLIATTRKSAEAMNNAATDATQFGIESEKSLGWGEKLLKSLQEQLAGSAFLGESLDLMEEFAPAAQLGASSWILFRDMGKGALKTFSGMGNLLLGTKESAGLLSGGLSLLGSAGSGAFKVINFMTGGLLKMGAAMLMNPIGIVITSVAALTAGIIYLVKNWDEVKAATIEYAQIAWGWLEKVGNAVWGFIGEPIGTAFDWIGDKFSWMWEKLTAGYDAASAVTESIFGAIKSAIMAPINLIKGFVNDWIISSLNSFLTYDLPLIGPVGELIGLSDIPYLAEGGIAMGKTLAVVGEKAPTEPEVIAPLSELASMLNLSPQVNVHVENKLEALVTEIRSLKNAILSQRSSGSARNPATQRVINWGRA